MAKISSKHLAVYEMFGTLLLVSTTCFTLSTTNYSTNLYIISFGLYIGLTVCGTITGGHFNPAVSFAVFFIKKKF